MPQSEKMIVKEIDVYDAVEFIQQYHYSKVMPKITKHYLGLMVDGELMGVTTLGWGTKPLHTISKFFPELNSDHYWEIGKQCVHPDMPKNTGTQLLSLITKWIKTNHPHKLFLYTLADGIMGKVGIQYQAFNFYYGGTFKTQIYKIGEEKCHPRSVRPLLNQNRKEVGNPVLGWLTSDFMNANGIEKIEGLMFRYWMPLNKKAKSLIKKNHPDWTQTDYPKEDALVWWNVTNGAKKKFEIEAPSFTFEDVVYNKRNVDAHKFDQIKVTDFV